MSYQPKRSYQARARKYGSRNIYMNTGTSGKPSFAGAWSAIKGFFSRGRGLWRWLFYFFIMAVLIGLLWFYIAIIKDLPSFEKMGDQFSQTTTITDRDGGALYQVYDENRQAVSFSEISPFLVDATVAAEDKNFWVNKGVDVNGLIRAVVTSVLHGNLQGPGGSTITQQLIKNMLLTKEKTLKRKFKEIVLATSIDGYLKDVVKQQNPDLKGEALDRAIKEKILEMYMNYVFLGNNAHGVQAASNTYFGKSVKDLTLFEASVLASSYQSPSTSNPYRNPKRVVGGLEVYVKGETEITQNSGAVAVAKERFAEEIKSSDKSLARSGDGVSSWLQDRGKFVFTHEGVEYETKYVPGRKDYVLSRMYEDKYVDEAQVKTAVTDGINYVFKKAIADIKAPHFVFWVQDFVKTSGCGEGKEIPVCLTDEELAKGGLTIKTTLDPQAQDIAEKSIVENMPTVNGYGANNSALVYIDSRDGNVLAYVGSANYNDESIDGMVDMVQQPRQPGSSIKPLVYAYGFMNLPLTLDTPIFDLSFKIGPDSPGNSDGGFSGLLPLRQALGYSRNIPAIKMYFAVGGQDKLVPFFNDIGVKTYDKTKDYGYPLSIGSAELQMIELANAYMHLSAMGRPAVINPILEIRGADGQIIYQKQTQQQKQIIPEGVAHLIWKALSESGNLPSSWVNNFRVRGLVYANKSGTTDVKDSKGKSLPRDGWLAGYTPSKVAIFWAGNTQGNAMNANAYGGWVNGKTFRQFFTQLLAASKIATEEVTPVETKNVTISRISGKLASESTPEGYRVSTMGYINTLPTEYDATFSPIQIDKACMGKVTDVTPRFDILDTYIITPSTFMPNGMDLPDITKWFESQMGSGTREDGTPLEFSQFVLKAPEQVCENRTLLEEDASVQVSILQPSTDAAVGNSTNVWYSVTSTKPLAAVRILVDEKNVGEYAYIGKTMISDIKTISLPEGADHVISVVAVNQDGGYGRSTISVKPAGEDKNPPRILDDHVSITENGQGGYTVLMLFVDDISAVKGGEIKMTNGVSLKKFNGSIASLDIQIPQELVYEVTDTAGNKLKGSVDVSLLVP